MAHRQTPKRSTTTTASGTGTVASGLYSVNAIKPSSDCDGKTQRLDHDNTCIQIWNHGPSNDRSWASIRSSSSQPADNLEHNGKYIFSDKSGTGIHVQAGRGLRSDHQCGLRTELVGSCFVLFVWSSRIFHVIIMIG